MATDRASAAIRVLQKAGFRGARLKVAFGIVMAESGGNPRAHNPNRSTGDDSYGLAQINMLGDLGPARRKQYGLKSNDQLFDPATNAQVMYRMSGGGRDFSPWTTFKSGAYRRHPFPGAAPAGDRPGPAAPSSSAPPGTPSFDRQGLALALLGRSRARRGADMGERFDMEEDGSISAPRLPSGAGADYSRLSFMLRLAQALQPSRDAAAAFQPKRPSVGGLTPDMLTRDRNAIQLPAAFHGTHITDGLDWNHGRRTAVDIMGKPGTPVLAPVDGKVVRWGSAQGGEALYLDDDDPDDDPDYWLGHVDRRLPVGTRVRRGQRIARISRDHPRPHAHWDRKL